MRLRILALSAALAMTAPALALAQDAAPPAGAKAAYSSATTEIGTLLDDPAAKAVLVKHVPEMATDEQIDMARAMTLKDVQQYSPDDLTDAKLAEIDADLAKLTPAK